MRILVPTHVIPTKKNKLINYIESIVENLEDTELFWFIFQPDSVKTKNRFELDIHDFNNAVELLEKIKPDCVFANNNSREPISYSLSIAAKFLGIPLIHYYLNDLVPILGDQPDTTFSKNSSRLIRNFFSNKVATDVQNNTATMRRGRFFYYKNMFLFRTRKEIGFNFFSSLKLFVNDLTTYFFYKKPIWNKLADLNLCSNIDYYDFLTNIGIDKRKIIVSGSPFWDKIYKKVKSRERISKMSSNNVCILIVTGSLVEHGFWSVQQREKYLKKIFEELQKLENVSFDLKIHPASEDVTFYKKFLEKLNIKSKIFQKENIWDIIGNYDLVLSYSFSTVHTECAYGGVKMILLDVDWNFKKFALVKEAISSGFIKECKKFEDIGKDVIDLLNIEVRFNDELVKARERLAYKFDGNAGKRAADAVVQLYQNSKMDKPN